MVLWRVFQLPAGASAAPKAGSGYDHAIAPQAAARPAAASAPRTQDEDGEGRPPAAATPAAEDWEWVVVGQAAAHAASGGGCAAGRKGTIMVDAYVMRELDEEVMRELEEEETEETVGQTSTSSNTASDSLRDCDAPSESLEQSDDEFVDLEVAKQATPYEEAEPNTPAAAAAAAAHVNPSEASPQSNQCDAAGDDEYEPTVDDPVFQCVTCCTSILKASDIISSSYRAVTGPGYLTGAARNITTSEETQEAVYTSGRYDVREVSCKNCQTKLGITYVGAAVLWNKHKVGKFLLGQDLLEKVTR